MYKRLIFGLAMALVLALAACNGAPTPQPTAVESPAPSQASTQADTATATAGPTATPSATATSTTTSTATSTATPTPIVTYGPDVYPADINPLTGLKVDDPALLERRPIAVKVNIVPRSYYRPPWGLSFADIVYEYPHSSIGPDRFHAIFYGKDAELVGPIRSGRLPDDDLIRMYKSNFAYGSADARINYVFFSASYANRLILEGAQSNCPPTAAAPLCRFDRTGYDHLLGGTQAISQYITARGANNEKQDLRGMYFSSQAPQGGKASKQVTVRFSFADYNRWEFEPLTGRYLRFQDQAEDTGQGETYEPLVDRLTNQQIAADNVVILIIPYTYYDKKAGIIDLTFGTAGKAYAFRDGQMYEVNWNRPTEDSVLYLVNADGTPYPFKPGATWFEIVNEYSEITTLDDGSWRFNFFMP